MSSILKKGLLCYLNTCFSNNYFTSKRCETLVNGLAFGVLEDQIYSFRRRVDNILAFSRIQTITEGKKILGYNKRSNNIMEIIQSVYELFHSSLEKDKIRFSYKLPKNLYLTIDKSCFTDVFVNLMANSIRSIKAKRIVNKKTIDDYPGVISINVKKTNVLVLFSIMDNGVGIKKGEEERIFEQFYSSTSEGGDLTKGSIGIGLFVCKKYIEDHGGKIWVERSKDNTVIFKIELPYK